MPDAGPQRNRRSDGDPAGAVRADADRQADHAGIARLTDGLLPALIAKLGSTQLGELEVREGDWQVRLRRPFGTAPGEGRRATDKPSRAQPGHDLGRDRAQPHKGTARRGDPRPGCSTPPGTTSPRRGG